MDKRRELPLLPGMVPLPDAVTDANESFILRAVQYILHRQLPCPEGRNSFLNDLVLPLNTKTAVLTTKTSNVQIRIGELIDVHLKQVAVDVAACDNPLALLREYSSRWEMYKISKHAFQVALLRIWGVKSNNINEQLNAKRHIQTFLYDRWRKALLEPSAAILQQALHALLKTFRDTTLDSSSGGGGGTDVSTIRAMVDSYRELDPQLAQYYKDQWELPFLADTRKYYAQSCASYLQRESVSAYLALCERILDLEELVSSQFLHVKTKDQHRFCVNEVVITNHKDKLQEVVSTFIQEGKYEELRRIHRLFTRIRNLEPLVVLFSAFARSLFVTAFEQLVDQMESAKEALPIIYCKTFLEHYQKLEHTVQEAFNDGLHFKQALTDVARKVLNNNAVNKLDDPQEFSARFVARYADVLLADPKIEPQVLLEDFFNLKGVLLCFTLLASKDVFCRHYRVMFMNRLLKGRMCSRDHETHMIGAMRGVHDLQFSNMLTVMLRDIDSSRDKYGPESRFIPQGDIVLEPFVLTMASWPLDTRLQLHIIRLTPDLEKLSQRFQTKFQDVNHGKIVEWVHDRSMVLIEMRVPGPVGSGTTLTPAPATIPPNGTDGDVAPTPVGVGAGAGARTYRIIMNHPQYVVFEAIRTFEGTPTPEQISVATEMPLNWAQATIDSLGLCTLIQQNPKNKQCRVKPNFRATSLNLNASFKFQPPVKEETIDPQIEEDRVLATQAAIVRIMKARRVLDHATLCDEVTKQTSRFFPQKIERIKRQICRLIDGQTTYLERQDARTYRYVTGGED